MARFFAQQFGSVGSRSRIFGQHDPMNQALDRMALARMRDAAPRMLSGTAPDSVSDLQARKQLGGSDQGLFGIYYGERIYEPGGRGPVVRVGLLSDGTNGVERWTRTGQRQIPLWVNA